MDFNLTIIYGFELTGNGNYEHLETDKISIYNEGELGDRCFLGIEVDYFDMYSKHTDHLRIDRPKAAVRARLSSIATANGFKQPEFWTIGSYD